MKKASLLTLLFLFFLTFAQAQMQVGGRTLYGNEWINYDQTYYKIPVAKDGVYRISRQALEGAGISLAEQGERLQLFHLGEEVPIYIGENYIEFYGKQNRGELDRFLYENGEADMLNPEYSLITDTAAYFLTVAPAGTQGWRYTDVPNDLTNLPAPEAWYWAEEQRVYSNRVVQQSFNDIAESVFNAGEGYAVTRRINQPLEVSFTTPHRFDADVQDTLAVSMVGIGANAHEVSILANGSTLDQWSSFRYEMWQRNYTISNTAEETNVQILDVTGRIGVGYLRLVYPRQFNFDNQRAFTFEIEASDQVKYLEIENFNTGNANPVLYDLTNGLRIETTVENNLVKVKIPPSFRQRAFILINTQNGFTAVNQLQPITFQNFANTDAEFIIISNKRLYDDGNGNNWVAAYEQYRASEAGGSYRTLVVDVDDLYEQFAYGLSRHPLSIRNFAHFVKNRWTNPRYMLLIGKGRTYNAIRNNVSSNFYLPTFGAPGSDNLLAASPGTMMPIIPIGRVAASTPDDVRVYLNKIREYENPVTLKKENRAWRKEVIHLGGGGDAREQSSIRNALERMQDMIEQNAFGADVFSLYKTSSDPVQQSKSDALVAQINSGASILTFFGHSSPEGFDFAVDDPSTYQNKGRYPVIFSLGCLTGNFFTGGTNTASERFIFEEEKGAIAFISSTDNATIFPLSDFQSTYYNLLGDELYGKSIGEIMQRTINDRSDNGGLTYRTLLQQMAIHGDPAIVISPYDNPDYVIEENSVEFFPNIIDAQRDSFTVQFNVLNIGKAIEDSLLIEIVRAFPDQLQDTPIELKIAAPKSQQEVRVNIPTQGRRAIGANKIYIKLNTDNHIEEAPTPEASSNNEYFDVFGKRGAEVFVFSNTVEPVYPTNFSIVNEENITLQAVTTNINAPSQTYIMEMDTTANFDSPLRQRREINQSGGLIAWQPNLTLQDSTVYYWRVSPDSTAERGYLWRQHSFTYIKKSAPGWNQSHIYQFKENRLVNIFLPEATRRWNFALDQKTLEVGNTTYQGRGSYTPVGWIDGSPYIYQDYGPKINAGMQVYVLNGNTGQAWGNGRPGRFGSRVSWGTTAFPFSTLTTEQRATFINFLRDTIPSGHYVLMFSIQRPNLTYQPEEWESDTEILGTNLFEILEEQGATRIRETADSTARPYVFLYRKDDPSFTPFEKLADSTNQILEEEIAIFGNWYNGTITTPTIGNAKEWTELIWQASEIDSMDQLSVNIYGVRPDSSATLLVSDLTEFRAPLDGIDAQEYPMLRLEFNAEDEAERTMPQLDYWRIHYEGLPDATLAPNLHLRFQQDTIQQGEELQFEVAIANTSAYDLDSLLVQFALINEQGENILDSIRFKPLPQQDTMIVSWSPSTRFLKGQQRLIVEVNPNDDQPELYHFNNTGIFDFYAIADRRNPLLDVTFDGTRIMDGDLVSAKPLITIALEDENQFLLLSDTSLFSIFLEKPNPDDPITPIVVPVNLNTDNIYFEPAESQKRNRATIEWQEEFTESGEYALLVQAKDVTGNASGAVDFKVRFNVITESQISNVLNYPNPFSTSTRFVYTLTGAEPPADYMIRIMTISGRIVRELTATDLGPLKIGTHQTDFAWDGTDAFGDRLANGVYLYQFIARDQSGNELARYENSTDRFFKNNIGKLVILR
jgi:hypothetical protein